MLKESQSHCSIAILMHPVANVARTETDVLENSYYDWEKQRGEMNNEPKCQVCYSEQVYSDYSTQITYSVFCHVLIFLHLQSLNPGAECWPVKEVFCLLSVKKWMKCTETIWLIYSVCFWNVFWFFFPQSWLERCPFSLISLLQPDVQTCPLESRTTGREWEKVKNTH